MSEPILSSRRYVLAEDAEGYLLIDRESPDAPLERFPLTEEGFDAAVGAFEDAKRRDRRERQVVPTWIWIMMLVAVGVWFAAGVIVSLQFFGPFFVSAPDGWADDLFSIVTVIDQVGFRMTLAAIAILAAMLLLRRLRERPVEGGWDGAPRYPVGTVDRVLVAALVLGLAGWVLSSVLTQVLFPFDPRFVPFPGEGTPEGPSVATELSMSIDALSFRVWVAAAVGLTARWALWRARETGESPAEA